MTSKARTLHMAEERANDRSVLGWGVLGFFTLFIGIIIVHIRRPRVRAATPTAPPYRAARTGTDVGTSAVPAPSSS